MIPKQQQSALRGILFRHLDGIVTAPSAYVLFRKGVTAHLLEKGEADVTDLARQFSANEGYLNVALRVLASQGWLEMQVDNAQDRVIYRMTPRGRIAFPLFGMFKEAVDLLRITEEFHPRRFEVKPFRQLEKLFEAYQRSFGLAEPTGPEEKEVREQLFLHVQGIILGPTIVHLGMGGMFHKYFMETSFRPEEFHKDPESFGRLLEIFAYFGWFTHTNGVFEFTETGLFFAKRASAYGVTVSYIPTLRRLDDLLFGDFREIKARTAAKEEMHVDRAMNVWGSGGAHATYFKVVDEILIDLFNRPIEQQPRGVLDMGCGNGAFLEHIFDVIEKFTLRGKMLEEHPLILVGADYNEAALRITKANLIQADIWAKVIWGDIGRPDKLDEDLRRQYNVPLSDLLNARTFLDHNRIWQEPVQVNGSRVSQSTGAFAFEGKRLSNNRVEASLLEHLRRWKPYVEKHGLLLIELHTVDPALTASHLGATGATAYDATHGYSDQYILEAGVFDVVAAEAGLRADPRLSRKFPDAELATVTVNLFRAD